MRKVVTGHGRSSRREGQNIQFPFFCVARPGLIGLPANLLLRSSKMTLDEKIDLNYVRNLSASFPPIFGGFFLPPVGFIVEDMGPPLC